jgi:DNA-binding transcriptional ArsR family regulator
LADPVRLGIVQALADEEEGVSCVDMMHRTRTRLPKSTCSQHYQILREAGLITSERKGVELVSRLRRKELNRRFPGLIDTILTAHQPTTKRRSA